MDLNADKSKILIIKKLVEDCLTELNISQPKIIIITQDEYCKKYKSFGGYNPEEDKIYTVVTKRNLADICRTLAHELYHHYQKTNNLLTLESGKDGDDIENAANSYAGLKLRKFGRENPNIYFEYFE
jgi:hypothetical protein